MKVRRKIYEGLIAQGEALAAALHEEKSKRQLWTRKYYSLLLGIESARREADGGTDAATTRFGTETNGAGPALDAAVGITGAANGSAGTAASVARVEKSTASVAAPFLTTSGLDSDGFYHSHGDCKSPEAFGLTPDWMVANAVSDAPSTVALTTELTRPEPTAGGYGDGTPLPSTVPACNALSRNSRGPLSHDTSINSAI